MRMKVNGIHIRMLPCILITILVALLLRTGVAEAISALNCGTWNIVPSPNKGKSHVNNELAGVAAISTNDVWTVGDYFGAFKDLTLIEHWNGTQWTNISSPNKGTFENVLFGVAAVSTNDVWAVGSTTNGSTYLTQTLIEHWNGTKWSIVSSPKIGTNFSELYAVTALSSNNVWAVGDYGDNNAPAQTLVEHWNGTNWSIILSPDMGGEANELVGVAAVSTNDVWAVGDYENSVEQTLVQQTLVEHWDGTKWSVISSPNAGAGNNILSEVTAVPGSNQLWAVGHSDPGVPLIENWNGTQWTIVSNPNVGGSLYGVTGISESNVWAVGGQSNNMALIEQWNGSAWNIVPSPRISNPYLSSVSAVNGTGQIWAVGDYSGKGDVRTLTEFYC